MKKAYQHMRQGEGMMAMLYVYFANFSYPLSLRQIRHFNEMVKAQRASKKDIKEG